MYINPALPPQIPQIRIRDFFYAGAGFSAFMNQSHTAITRFDTSSKTAVFDKFANTSLPFAVDIPGVNDETSTLDDNTALHSIAINQTITIPNRQYFSNTTTPGNVLQCLPVIAESAYAAGQFPEAAVDGAVATRWQPASNESSSFLINTTSLVTGPMGYVQVGSLFFDWGGRPPRNVTLLFANHTSMDNTSSSSLSSQQKKITIVGPAQIINLPGITPSKPYNPNITQDTAAEVQVVPYVGNSTSIDVENEAW